MTHLATAICLILCLGACGGGGGGGSGSGIDPRLARLDIYEAQKIRVLGDPGAGVPSMPMTAEADMPTMGAMAFTGAGSIRVEGAVPLVIFGDARLTVDFEGGLADGAIENSFGTNAAGSVVNYGGVIALSSDAAVQNMALRYEGTLSEGDISIGFTGTMDGIFLGAAPSAISAADLEAVIDHDGAARTGTLVVVLEQSDD